MGTHCYIIGVTKEIRRQIGKSFGDIVEVVLQERDGEKPQTVRESSLHSYRDLPGEKDIG